jgi:hypothetical protein
MLNANLVPPLGHRMPGRQPLACLFVFVKRSDHRWSFVLRTLLVQLVTWASRSTGLDLPITNQNALQVLIAGNRCEQINPASSH